MASLPSVCNVNKKNIKMFPPIQNPREQDGLWLNEKGGCEML